MVFTTNLCLTSDKVHPLNVAMVTEQLFEVLPWDLVIDPMEVQDTSLLKVIKLTLEERDNNFSESHVGFKKHN